MTARFKVVRGTVRENKHVCDECMWALAFKGLPELFTCEQPDSDHYLHIFQGFHPACSHFKAGINKGCGDDGFIRAFYEAFYGKPAEGGTGE